MFDAVNAACNSAGEAEQFQEVILMFNMLIVQT
jgi:hypothetical protein